MKLELTIILILSIGLVSAVYQGEILNINLSDKFDSIVDYTFEGNLTSINSSLNNLTLSIIIPVDYSPSSFKIWVSGYNSNKDIIKEVITAKEVYVYSGGGVYIPPSKRNQTNNTSNITITPQINNTIQEEIPITFIPEKKSYTWLIISGITLTIILIVGLILYFKKDDEILPQP